MRRDIIVPLIVVCAIIVGAIAIQQNINSNSSNTPNGSNVFDVQFNYHGVAGTIGRFATVDSWDIRIIKLQTGTLRNVDIFTSEGSTMKLQAHFDYYDMETHGLSVKQVVNQTLAVDIYWEGGYAGFYCNPLDN